MITSIFPAKCKVCYKKEQTGLSVTPPTINNNTSNNNNSSNNNNNSNSNNNNSSNNNNNNNLHSLTAANITAFNLGKRNTRTQDSDEEDTIAGFMH
jgi:hypothetical protein